MKKMVWCDLFEDVEGVLEARRIKNSERKKKTAVSHYV